MDFIIHQPNGGNSTLIGIVDYSGKVKGTGG